MQTAELVAENLTQFCPITNHYLLSDGRYVLVTVARIAGAATLSNFGVRVPISLSQLPSEVDVFLSDAAANVLDADGDPANGMTPLASFNVTTHEEALMALGYTAAAADEVSQ